MYKQKRNTILLYLVLLLIGGIVGYTYTTIDLLVLFVLIFTFSYIEFPQKNLMQIILSITCSATIELIVSRLFVEVYYRVSKIKNETTTNLILVLGIILSFIFCIIAATSLKNKLYTYLHRENKLNSAAFLMHGVST